MRHFGIYANSGDVQTALNEETLVNPYVALVSGTLDYDTLEQQSCEERGLCGDDPTDCHECTCEEQFSDPADICECEGRFFWDGECHDEPEPVDPCEGDPECECIQQGGTWEGSECVMSSDDPCDGDPECTCNQDSGYNWWDDGTCHNCFDEWESLGYSSPEDCACDKRGEDSGVCPESDPCEGYGSPEECECAQQGGTWSGSECQ